MRINVHLNRPARKQINFWNHIHFHPTDAIEDRWGQRILGRIERDHAAKMIRMHTMFEDMVTRGADGALHEVTKFEYFMPDLLGVASQLGAKCRIALLRDTANLTGPLRNLTVDALPAKDIYKLALAQLAKLYCDITLARAAGLTVEDGALIEVQGLTRSGEYADYATDAQLLIDEQHTVPETPSY